MIRASTAVAAFVVLVAAMGLAGCSAEPDELDGHLPAGPDAPSPEPRSYSDRELAAALPRGARQLHGFEVEDQCRDITRPCVDGANPGTVSIFATRTNDDSLLITVNESWKRPFWRTVVRDFCPRGRVETPIEQLDAGRFSPGERGVAHRTPTSIGTWHGLHCEKSVTYVFPSNYPSAWNGDASKGEEHTLLLTNGFHYLQVQSSSHELTRRLVEEYLDRLG